jgi:hypothetical protein
MTTHELARLLLSYPDLPVAITAMGHTYSEEMHRGSRGPLEIGTMKSYVGDHIVVGDMLQHSNNYPNSYITHVLYPVAKDIRSFYEDR